MVITVNLNPNIDRYLKISGFLYGGLNRVLESRDDATSKGINVARVLKTLGETSVCTGFMYEQNGKLAITRLEKENIGHDYVWQTGAMRTNIKLYDDKSGLLTEINEKGVPVSEEHLARLEEKIRIYADKQNIIVFTGSMPPGCPEGFFAEMMKLAAGRGAVCILDAEGGVLREGILSRPYMVKMNTFELSSFAEKKIDSESEIIQECRKITNYGVALIVVSLGAEGAIMTDGRKVFKARGIPIEAISPTGSGDTMVAALVRGIVRSQSMETMLKSASAAATATALCEGTRLMTMELYNSLSNHVIIEELS
jgi:1-phosphofructokinase